ncbi:MAG: DUF4386 domain-containing protein [Candidatus Omnitrophica bacterium]|nr:DUF4386 domain-containing protein [Candidatus Omnitrophota bacterium]
MEMNSNSLKNTARFAGLLYLIWIITGLFAMFYVPSQINMKGDAAATAQNILSNEFLFRASIVNDIFSGTLWIIMVLVFYRLFKPADKFQAKLLVALVMVQIPNIFFMEALNIASLMSFKGEILKTFELAQRQDLAMLFLKINDYVVIILEAFWGLWLIPLAILVYKSRFLPRFLGVWLALTGLFYLALSFTDIMMPQYRQMVLNSPIALPLELGEVAFMLWLLIMGAKEKTVNSVPVQ